MDGKQEYSTILLIPRRPICIVIGIELIIILNFGILRAFIRHNHFLVLSDFSIPYTSDVDASYDGHC